MSDEFERNKADLQTTSLHFKDTELDEELNMVNLNCASTVHLSKYVVQHMADGFVDGLAQWLNTVSSLTVKVAAQGEALRPNTAYLAPDSRHLGVTPRFTIALSPQVTTNANGRFRLTGIGRNRVVMEKRSDGQRASA